MLCIFGQGPFTINVPINGNIRWDTEAEQSYGLNEMAQCELQSAWGGVRMGWEKLTLFGGWLSYKM